MEALGGKDKQLAQLVDASNAVFATFAKEDQNVQSTLHLLPGALAKTRTGLGKLATAANVLGPTLRQLRPFASSLGPPSKPRGGSRSTTTPIFKNQIRPFARQILPTINELRPDTQALSEAFPKLATSFSVLNEFFNELANNPGAKQGRLPVLPGLGQPQPQQRRQLRRRARRARPHLVYLNCEVAPLLKGVAEINPTVNLIVGLLNPPDAGRRVRAPGSSKPRAAPRAHSRPKAPAGGLLSGLGPQAFGKAPPKASRGGG